MTEEQLARANEIMVDIALCNKVVEQTAAERDLTIRFTRDLPIRFTDSLCCEVIPQDTVCMMSPKWLTDVIEHAVIEHRAKLYEEFKGL